MMPLLRKHRGRPAGSRLLSQRAEALLSSLLDRTVASWGAGVTQDRDVVAITLVFGDDTEFEFYLRGDGMATGPVRFTPPLEAGENLTP